MDRIDPRLIAFPREVVDGAVKEAVNSVESIGDRARIKVRIESDARFFAEVRKLVCDLAMTMMFAKTIDIKADFEDLVNEIGIDRVSGDAASIAEGIVKYARSVKSSSGGLSVFVSMDEYMSRVDMVDGLLFQ